MNDFQKKQEEINNLAETHFTKFVLVFGVIGIVASLPTFAMNVGQLGIMMIIQSLICIGFSHFIKNQNKQNLILYEILKKLEKPDTKEESNKE